MAWQWEITVWKWPIFIVRIAYRLRMILIPRRNHFIHFSLLLHVPSIPSIIHSPYFPFSLLWISSDIFRGLITFCPIPRSSIQIHLVFADLISNRFILLQQNSFIHRIFLVAHLTSRAYAVMFYVSVSFCISVSVSLASFIRSLSLCPWISVRACFSVSVATGRGNGWLL